jgi:hypothetical protein
LAGADGEIHRQRERRRLEITRLEIHAVDPQEREAADDEHSADDAHVKEMRLDQRSRQRADHRRGQKGNEHADDETRSCPFGEHVRRQRPDAAEINTQQCQDCAELDKNRERLAEGIVTPAEEMLHQQQVACRGNGKELGESFHDTENSRLDQVDVRQHQVNGGRLDRGGIHSLLRKEGRRESW